MPRYLLHILAAAATILFAAALAPAADGAVDARWSLLQQHLTSVDTIPARETATSGKSAFDHSEIMRPSLQGRPRIALPQRQIPEHRSVGGSGIGSDRRREQHAGRSAIPSHVRLNVYLFNSVLLI